MTGCRPTALFLVLAASLASPAALAQGERLPWVRMFECPAQANGAPFASVALMARRDFALCRYQDGSTERLDIAPGCVLGQVDRAHDGMADGQRIAVHECEARVQGPARCRISCRGMQ